MKNITKFTFAALAALAVTLLFQTPITRAGDNGKKGDDNGHKLRLRVYFDSSHFTLADPNAVTVGDQYTFGATLARFERPNQQIGTFGVQFVQTSVERDEAVGFGTLNLADGQISFSGLLLNPRIPVPLTGGTGAYLGARGQIDHQSLANGVEEFILTFVGN